MKTTIIALIALVIGFGAAYLLVPQTGNGTPSATETDRQQFTCGMHPEIIADEPGYCPICSMKLTPKKNGAAPTGSLTIDPTTRQNMGLVTAAAMYQPLTRHIHAFGRIDYAEPRVHAVNVKINGWIEHLYVDYEGERVYKGQPLLEVYSPDLVAAQKEFLIAHAAGDTSPGGMTDLLQAARKRLQNWDISDDQIEQLLATGEVTRTLKIRAPADGVIIVKKVSEGDNLRPGAELYRIADLSSVWVVAHVYEQDLPFVKVGQPATVHMPNLPGEELEGTVSYVSSFLDAGRQVEIRLDVPNSDYRLKPEMYAEVTLHAELPSERLAIPRAAVINSGARQVVYVASGRDSFEPRVVTTGAIGDGDLVEVRSGLTDNEQVVTSGQFLLDSESRLNEALGGMHQHAHTSGTDKGDENRHEATPAFAEKERSGVYTCPMPEHYHVLQYGEGECFECSMKLVPIEDTDNKGVYVCPMPQDSVVSAAPGSCPKCGMNLVKHRPEAEHDH